MAENGKKLIKRQANQLQKVCQVQLELIAKILQKIIAKQTDFLGQVDILSSSYFSSPPNLQINGHEINIH